MSSTQSSPGNGDSKESRFKFLFNYARFKQGIPEKPDVTKPEADATEKASTWKRFRNAIARDT